MKEEQIENIRNKNIIDMAITFTAMMRVFRQGSKSLISAKIEEIFSKLDNISDEKQYQDIHYSFCTWFIELVIPYSLLQGITSSIVPNKKISPTGNSAGLFSFWFGCPALVMLVVMRKINPSKIN